MMQAKTGGAPAYQHASRKHERAEDQYYKSIYELDVMGGKLQIMTNLMAIMKTIAQCNDVLSLNPTDVEKTAIVREQQQVVSREVW